MQRSNILNMFINIVIVVFAFVNIYKFFAVVSNPQTLRNTDFMSYYTAGKIVADGNLQNIYDLGLQEKYYKELTGNNYFLPYRALAFVGLVFAPLALLPIEISFGLFFLINILLIVYLFIYLLKNFEHKAPGIQLAIGLLGFVPLAMALGIGQTSIVLLGIFVGIYALIKKEQYFYAGVVTSLILIKLQFIVAIPFLLLLITNKSRYLKGLIAGILGGVLLNYLITTNPGEFINLLLHTENLQFNTPITRMFSIQFFLHLYLKLDLIISVSISILVYLAVLAMFYKHQKNDLTENFAIALLLALPFGFHVLTHDLTLLVFPFLYYLNSSKYKSIFVGFYISIFFLYKIIPGVLGILLLGLGIYILTNTNEKHKRYLKK